MASFIEIRGRIFEGVFERRLTRFSAQVRVNGKITQCFLPNPGRLSELLFSGAKVVLKEGEAGGERKTIYDIIGVYHGGKIVSIDSRLPNKLVLEALKNEDLPEFLGYTMIKPEYSYGHAKFDFFLKGSELKPCLLEVKSCTLVRNGVAMFPDAPTERGTRHVLGLAKALNEGYRTSVLFIVQRMDACMFAPNDETDPDFGKALRKAAEHGVEVYAYSANFSKNRMSLCGKVKVAL